MKKKGCSPGETRINNECLPEIHRGYNNHPVINMNLNKLWHITGNTIENKKIGPNGYLEFYPSTAPTVHPGMTDYIFYIKTQQYQKVPDYIFDLIEKKLISKGFTSGYKLVTKDMSNERRGKA